MKIIPFSPGANTPGPEARARGPLQGGDDFQRYMESAGQKLEAREKIGLENVIANETAPPGDLLEAASLLSGVLAQMALKSPSELGRIHSLEGLLRS
jgi:hypothetical protein